MYVCMYVLCRRFIILYVLTETCASEAQVEKPLLLPVATYRFYSVLQQTIFLVIAGMAQW